MVYEWSDVAGGSSGDRQRVEAVSSHARAQRYAVSLLINPILSARQNAKNERTVTGGRSGR